MSDRAGELLAAMQAVLKGDDAVKAAVAPAPVRAYDLPPQNAAFPYFALGDIHDEPVHAECVDAGVMVANIGIWTRGVVPGSASAMAIGAAARDALLKPGALDIMASQRVGQVFALDMRPVGEPEPDGQTVRVVLRMQIALSRAV